MKAQQGIPDLLTRPSREDRQGHLIEKEMDWKKLWWGMPSFDMRNQQPLQRIMVNFATRHDIQEFAKKLGILVPSTKANSMWFPKQSKMNGELIYKGPKKPTRYPICIPTKGRADCQLTGKALDKMGIPYKFFVEETEVRDYRKIHGREKVVRLPFHDLGQGSIPARNYIWEWCKERGHERHWVLDDNIVGFTRCTHNRRIRAVTSSIFHAMEDFVDRYTNIAMAGPHHIGFMPDRQVTAPFLLNSRVYSCILIRTDLPFRWRGRYNEDTDLSLRCLKAGWVTILFRALLMHKGSTMKMKGGNTDNVYNTGDYRLAFAKSLQEQHPDVTTVAWKFKRWHHSVDYSKFRKNKLILKPGITPVNTTNEYGMELVRVK